MPSTIVAGRAYSPILVIDNPNKVYGEDKDNDEVCPTRVSEELSPESMHLVLDMLLKSFHLSVRFEVNAVPFLLVTIQPTLHR